MVTVKRLRRAKPAENEEDSVCNDIGEDIPDRLTDVDTGRQKSAISAFIKQRARLDRAQFKHALEKMRGMEFEDEDDDEVYDFRHEEIDEAEYDHEFVNLEENNLEVRLERSEKQQTT